MRLNQVFGPVPDANFDRVCAGLTHERVRTDADALQIYSPPGAKLLQRIGLEFRKLLLIKRRDVADVETGYHRIEREADRCADYTVRGKLKCCGSTGICWIIDGNPSTPIVEHDGGDLRVRAEYGYDARLHPRWLPLLAS